MRIDGITGYILATLLITLGFGSMIAICSIAAEEIEEWAKNKVKKDDDKH